MHLRQVFILVALVALAFGEASKLPLDSALSDLSDLSKLVGFNISKLLSDYDAESGDEAFEHQKLKKRNPNPASNHLWDTSKCKGRKFMAQMGYSDYDAGQMLPQPLNTIASPWTYQDLGGWGWTMSSVAYSYRNFESGEEWGIADFLKHIGYSDKCREDGGTWTAISLTHYVPAKWPSPNNIHVQKYVDPYGQERRMTGGRAYMSSNEEGGMLIQNVLAPANAALRYHAGNMPRHELPALNKLSDLMWAMWEYYTPQEKLANINFFMPLQIVNPPTLSILDRAMLSTGQALSPAPIRFDPNSDAGLALLGSPLGSPIAHFIIGHKSKIGIKRLSAVWAMQPLSKSGAPALMFQFEHLNQPVPRPNDGQSQEHDPNADPNAPVGGSGAAAKKKRTLKNNNFVRLHTFQNDGNLTLESHYM